LPRFSLPNNKVFMHLPPFYYLSKGKKPVRKNNFYELIHKNLTSLILYAIIYATLIYYC
jgi:hypothetical protein